MTSNEAAVKALQLFSERASLCDVPSAKLAKPSDQHKQSSTLGTDPSTESIDMDVNAGDDTNNRTLPTEVVDDGTSASSSAKSNPNQEKDAGSGTGALLDIEVSGGLTEHLLVSTIQECRETDYYARLRILLWAVFSNEAALKRSFLLPMSSVAEKNESLEKSKTKEEQKHKQNHAACVSSKSSNNCPCVQESGCKVVACSSDVSANIDSNLTKEQLQSKQGDLDKDIDCQEDSCIDESLTTSETETKDEEAPKSVCSKSDNKAVSDEGAVGATTDEVNTNWAPTVDVDAVRRAYSVLFKCPESEFGETLINAVIRLLWDSLSIQLSVCPETFSADPLNANVFVILLENPSLTSTEYIESVLGDLCRVVSQLGVTQHATLVHHLANNWDRTRLHGLLQALHQLITIKLLTTEFNRDLTINEEANITAATKLMKLIYYASLLGGQLDYPLLKDIPPEDVPVSGSSLASDIFLGVGKEGVGKPPPWDPLAEALGVHPLDARSPLVPFDEFYDDFLSDQLEMDRDFSYYKAGNNDKFSFLDHPFILTPATKALGLYYDNRMRMYSERRISIYQTVIDGTPANPYLKLQVRRDHIIDDTLMGVRNRFLTTFLVYI